MWSQLKAKLFGGRDAKWSQSSFLISMVVHGGFILLAVSVVAIKTFNKPKPEMIYYVRPKMVRPPLEMKVKPQELQKSSARPRMAPRVVAMTPTTISMPAIKDVSPNPSLALSRSMLSRSSLGQGMWGNLGQGFGPMGSGIRIPEMLSGRCDPSNRLHLLRENGAGPEVDEAVTRALNWFRDSQNADGSWGTDDYRTAMTGLVLLAYMGRCETDKSRYFGPTVTKGIEYLLKMGREHDGLLVVSKDFEGASWNSGKVGNHYPYAHAIAALGLAETLAMTQRAEIRPVLEQAVQIIIDGQNKENGGWMYAYQTRGVMDLSVSVWHIQALKSAKLAGIRNPDLEPALDRAVNELVRLQQPDGAFPYQTYGADAKNHRMTMPMTGASLLALQMHGRPPPPELVRKAVDYILANDLVDDPDKPINVYRWYYDTFALFLSGERWDVWNNAFRNYLLVNQADEGNWPATICRNPSMGGGTGPTWETYRTALCTLMLEVYYRYLPSASAPTTGLRK